MGTVVNVSMIFTIYLFVVFIGAVFVFWDAGKRNMNAIGWAFIVFFVPMLLGLIVYLVCRNPMIDMQCPNCGAGIEKGQKECYQCKLQLLTQCPECGFPVQKGWKSCPKCGVGLPETYEQPVRAYRKDNGIVVIIVIVVLVVLGVLWASFSLVNNRQEGHFSEGYSGYEGMYNISKEDMSGNETIVSWIEASDTSKEDIHVLLSKSNGTALIYVKNEKSLMNSNIELEYLDNEEIEAIWLARGGYGGIRIIDKLDFTKFLQHPP